MTLWHKVSLTGFVVWGIGLLLQSTSYSAESRSVGNFVAGCGIIAFFAGIIGVIWT